MIAGAPATGDGMADPTPLTPMPPSGSVETDMDSRLKAAGIDAREITVTGGPSASVRSSYLRWFLLRALPAAGPAITRFELRNATITDEFDLRGATVGVILRFVDCVFLKELQLTDAKVIGIDFVGGKIESIAGDRLSAEGSLRLLAPKFVIQEAKTAPKNKLQLGTWIKQIRLCGAHIHGNLDFRGSRLGGAIEGERIMRPLLADGITVDGNVLLSKDFRAEGEVCLNGSEINRNLDCSGAKLTNHYGYSLSAAGAKISGAALLCKQYWRDKDDDDEDFNRIFQSEGVVRFDGAKISGNLNCVNGRFSATAFAVDGWHPDDPRNKDARHDSAAGAIHAIKAYGVEIGGDVSFGSTSTDENRFDIQGMVALIGTQIGGDLYISSARLNFPGEQVVCADVITVNGTTFIDKTYSNGVLSFIQATLKQGLTVSEVTFDVTQGSRHWANDKTDTDEDLEGPACGVYAALAEVTGTFVWQNIKKFAPSPGKIRLWLNLFASKGSTIEDDRQSWEALDRFDVTSAQYESIAHLAGSDVDWRLRELDRQYALFNRRFFWVARDLILGWLTGRKHTCERYFACEPKKKDKPPEIPDSFDSAREREIFFSEYDRARFERQRQDDKTLTEAITRFKPQPYLQLARTYRAAGYHSAARDVLVRLERNETRYSDISVFAILWRWLLDLTIQYGHALLRPIIILAIWIVVSATVFEIAFDHKKIVQLKENTASTPPVTGNSSGKSDSSKETAKVPEFNSLIFAIDTLLPIVDLNQKKSWTVNPISKSGVHPPNESIGVVEALNLVWRQIPDWGGAALLIFNTFFGWLMTTLFVAGVSGLIRPKGG